MALSTKIISTFVLTLITISSHGQGNISYDYISPSSLTDGKQCQYGSGSMQILSGNYNIPLSIKQSPTQQPTAWAANVHLTYSVLCNKGAAKKFNPNDIFNGSLNITHIRPISKKWHLMASVGGGIYAPTNEISAKSILANGGVVFVYKINEHLNIGGGVGLTNSYGIPMVMPMMYFNWQKRGKYEFCIDMSNGLKVSSGIWLNRTIKVELAALDMDGMSAVMNIEGKSRIYSTTMLKSHICPSFHFGKHMEFYAGIGGNWLRGIKISERNLKGFLKTLKEEDEEEKWRFGIALRTFAGIKFKF